MEFYPEHMRGKGEVVWTAPRPQDEALAAFREAMRRAPEVMAVRAQVAFKRSEAGRQLAQAVSDAERAQRMREVLLVQGLRVTSAEVTSVPPPAVGSEIPMKETPPPTVGAIVEEIREAAKRDRGGK